MNALGGERAEGGWVREQLVERTWRENERERRGCCHKRKAFNTTSLVSQSPSPYQVQMRVRRHIEAEYEFRNQRRGEEELCRLLAKFFHEACDHRAVESIEMLSHPVRMSDEAASTISYVGLLWIFMNFHMMSTEYLNLLFFCAVQAQRSLFWVRRFSTRKAQTGLP